MSEVDDRVVAMQFDNAAFERRIAETIRSLDKLQQSLDMANSKRGLDELNEASKRFNLNSMSGAIEGMSTKFLALSTIGITALASITTKAIDAGARITKALSIGPAFDGFREYETNMNSFQTI